MAYTIASACELCKDTLHPPQWGGGARSFGISQTVVGTFETNPCAECQGGTCAYLSTSLVPLTSGALSRSWATNSI